MLDWRVKTPTIAGPMEGASVPWSAVWAIGLIVASIFFPLNIFYDGLTSIGVAFTTGLVLWVLASVRTRQDRDWINILIERLFCRAKVLCMYLWNKFYYGWPV